MPNSIPELPAPAKKTLLEEILEWSEKSLPMWQRDALRRLFLRASAELALADFQELYVLLKKGTGVPGGVDVSSISRLTD